MFTLVGLTAPSGRRVYVDYTDILRVFDGDGDGRATMVRLRSDPQHGLWVKESPDEVAAKVLSVVQSAQMVTR